MSSDPVPILLVLVLVASVLVSPSFSAFVLPIHKDRDVNQYYISVNLPTPTNLIIDLENYHTWVKCSSQTYKSKAYHTIPCNTQLCTSLYGECPNDDFDNPLLDNPCSFSPWGVIETGNEVNGTIADSLTLPTTTDGIHEGPPGQIHDYIFSCAHEVDLTGFSRKVTGLVTFSRSNVSLPAQINKAASSPNIFALCLPSSSSSISPGAAFFGKPVYKKLSESLVYTPLLTTKSPFLSFYSAPRAEYYIGVASIKVNGKDLQLENPEQYQLDYRMGYGGTKISTLNPYTRLHPTIYAALTEAFVKESAAALNLTVSKAPAPAPLSVCYEARDVTLKRHRPVVPSIELVMHSEDVVWKMLGESSMVRIKREGVDLWCLAFVDHSQTGMASYVEIGGHQMENNLLEFDLESNRFGFTSLVSKSPKTTCSNVFHFN